MGKNVSEFVKKKHFFFLFVSATMFFLIIFGIMSQSSNRIVPPSHSTILLKFVSIDYMEAWNLSFFKVHF